MWKNSVFYVIIILVVSCNSENKCLSYLADHKQSMDILAIPVVKSGVDYGFFIGSNNQVYQTIYLIKYPEGEMDYGTFLLKLIRKEIVLDDILAAYNIEIIKYDQVIIKEFEINHYLFEKDGYYYFKDNISLSKQYNIVKILFDKSYQVNFNDYSGEYYFKKCEYSQY
jgi:hypothetical protein